VSLRTDAPGGCAEGCVLPEFQGYDLIIGGWTVILGHAVRSLICHVFSRLEDIWRFGGLDKNFGPNSGLRAAK
jgi:hypothetical protein